MFFRNERFRFGEVNISRSSELREMRAVSLVAVATAMTAVRSARSGADVIRLYDRALRRAPRHVAPTSAETNVAIAAIERALRSGELVAWREQRVGGAFQPSPPMALSGTDAPPDSAPAESTTWFEVTLVDAAGTPLDNVGVVWSVGGRTTRSRTDPSGTTRFDTAKGSGFATLRLTNVDAVREQLRARDVAADATTNATVYELTDAPPDFSAESERPSTIALMLSVATWVGIELVGEDGTPLAGHRFEVTFDDGSVSEGVVDDAGRARVSIPRTSTGDWTITFVDLDSSIIFEGEGRDT